MRPEQKARPTLNILECIDLLEPVKETFAVFRNNSQHVFEKVLKLTDDRLAKYDITSWNVTSVSREQHLPARVSESVMLSNLGRRLNMKNDDDLRQLWNEILDRELSELTSQFQED